MKKQLHGYIFFLVFTSLFLYLPTFIVTHAQQASGCAMIKVGNPPTNEQLPAGCGAAGAGALKAVAIAREQIGKKYVYGGPQPRNWQSWAYPANAPSVFDCSALVGWSWYWATDGKVNLPVSTSATWGKLPADKFEQHPASDKAKLQPGDVLYWSSPGDVHHTAMFSGPCQENGPGKGPGNCIIEAQQDGVPVKESNLDSRTKETWLGFYHPINY